MKKLLVVLLALVFFSTVLSADEGGALFEFHSMVGVTGPYVGPANPIRGLGGGGIPWAIRSGRTQLNANGRLEVGVRGLVLAAGNNAGTNPVANFGIVLSCQTTDAAGLATVTNVIVGTAPATAAGDAEFHGQVSTFPTPCIAPIVFVTTTPPATGLPRWLAATGF